MLHRILINDFADHYFTTLDPSVQTDRHTYTDPVTSIYELIIKNYLWGMWTFSVKWKVIMNINKIIITVITD